MVTGTREPATGAFERSPRAFGPEPRTLLAHSPTGLAAEGTLVPPLRAARLVQARPGRGRLAMMAVPGGVSHEQREDAAARAAPAG